MRTTVLGAAIVLGLLASCRKEPTGAAPPPPKPTPVAASGRVRIVEKRPEFDSVRRAPLLKAREELASLYRLRPDGRFLAAFAEARRLLRGGKTISVEVDFADGAWAIHCEGEDAGTLPEFPSYADARTILRAWIPRLATRIAKTTTDVSAIDAEVSRFTAPHLGLALAMVDKIWNRSAPDPKLARRAGHALTLLLLQGNDRLQMSDELAGRALAALTIGESLGDERLEADYALLARVLGYNADARNLASRLGERDPVRLYIESKSTPLKAAAEEHPDDRFLGYLAVRALPGKGRIAEWEAWVQPHFFSAETALATLHAELVLDDFESNPSAAEGVLGEWLRRLSSAKDPVASESPAVKSFGPLDSVLAGYLDSIREALHRKPAGIVRRLEEGLPRLVAGSEGPFWDTESERAWARSSFYSALTTLGLHYIDGLSSEEGAGAFAAFLEDVPPGPGAEFVRWYSNLAGAKRNESNQDLLVEDACRLHLGAEAASRSLSAASPRLQWTGEDVPRLVAEFAGRLDSRPAARVQLVGPLWRPAVNETRLRKLCQNCLGLSGSRLEVAIAAWCAGFLGDARGLVGIASDRAQSVGARAESLRTLTRWEALPPALIRLKYAALAEDAGYSRESISEYVFYLETLRDYSEELRVVEAHLAHNPGDTLTHVIYSGRRAHLLSMLGRHAEAWRAIEPEIASGQGAVMMWGAEILQKLGRSDEALQLARKALARYPDAEDIRAGAASLFFLANRHSEAALALGDTRFAQDGRIWRDTFAPAFAEAFKARPTEEAVRAFDAIRAERVGFWSLLEFIHALAGRGMNEAAFRMQDSLISPGIFEYAYSRIRAYQYLQKWQGEPAAIEWILANYKEKQRTLELAPVAVYSSGAHELLWTLIAPERTPSPDLAWLVRAAAAKLDGLPAHPHRAELLAHFQQAGPAATSRFWIGRFLMDLETEQKLFSEARTPQEQYELAYFLGVAAFAERRWGDAGDWLALARLRRMPPGWMASEAAALVWEMESRIGKQGITATREPKRSAK